MITTKHRVYLTKSNRKENIKVAQTDWRQGDYSRKSFLVDNSQQNEKEKATRCWPRHQMFRQASVHVKTLRRHWYSVLLMFGLAGCLLVYIHEDQHMQ